MGKAAKFATRKRDWGLKRALHWELMNALVKLGVRVHYVNVEGNVREILGEESPEVCVQATRRDTPGDVCIANFLGRELVGFAFVSFTRARVTKQLDVLVPDGFQYVYKGWTHIDHRRAKLAFARIYLRHKLLLADHGQRSISFVETHNYSSLLRGYTHPRERNLRMGFCGWITLFGRQIPFNSRRARWVGFEIVRKAHDGRRQYV